MPYRWIEHTGELELELEADSERGVFEAAFDRELISGDEAAQRLEIPVEVAGSDRAAMVADWLGELAFLAEARGLIPDRLAMFELDDCACDLSGWSRGDGAQALSAGSHSKHHRRLRSRRGLA